MNPRLLLFPILLSLLAGCSRQSGGTAGAAAAQAPEPVAVALATAELRKIERAVSVTGSLLPDDTTTVSAEVPGRVAKIHADFGQRVRKGQVVAEIDRHELGLQLERVRAALAQALARAGLSPGQEDAAPESSPLVRQAKAQLEDARFRYESAAKLVQSGDISQQRFTEVEKAYLARQAAYEAARDDLRTQLAGIQALRAEVRLAEKRFQDATVVAPFDGSVAQRHVAPGQYIRENTPILTLVKTHPLRLRAEIPEPFTASVRVGASLTFTTGAAPGATFHAVVRELNPALDPRSRALTAEARLVENDPRLLPGMFVQVRLVTDSGASVVVVPKEAVYTVAGLSKIFTVKDGKAVEHRVEVGQALEGWVEVPAGALQPGDRVAVSNQALLTGGAPVKPRS